MTVREIASRIQPAPAAPVRGPSHTEAPNPAERSDFAQQLRQAREQATSAPDGFKLSAHAQQRIEQRGISMTVNEQQSLSDALLHLQEKGSRDALLMRSDAAFIVNVQTRTVVTAVDADELRERIFTQIDSAVLL